MVELRILTVIYLRSKVPGESLKELSQNLQTVLISFSLKSESIVPSNLTILAN